jgi:uncharacterized cupredoxin-like copper-binding protein
MSVQRSIALAVAGAAAALAVAGCGEEEPAATDSGAGEPVATVEVSEVEYALEPADATVDESGLIEFVATNDGEIDHSLEVEGPEEAETETIAPGDSATVSLELPPGEYKWYCPIGDHEQQGMVGTVTVAGGGGSSGGSETESEGETETETESETESESEGADDSASGSSPY